MSRSNAVVWIDHRSAQVLRLGADEVKARHVKAHTHHTRQHGSTVRTEHEFFGEVCDALVGVAEVLVTGAHTTQSDFKHYATKHRPAVAALIVGFETADHPSENQLGARGRAYFLERDRAAGTATPN